MDPRPVRRAFALLPLLMAASACASPSNVDGPRTDGGGPRAASSVTAPATSALTPWSRQGAATPAGSAGAAGPPVASALIASALDELLAAAPATKSRPTGADGSAAIGEDTGRPLPEGADAGASVEPARGPRVTVGAPQVQPPMSTPSIERAARAQLYWDLVQGCRDPAGKLLPADAVALTFNIDAEGYIVPSSITAVSADPRFAEAAHCMRRTLSATTFRAPASARGQPASVKATVPSVD